MCKVQMLRALVKQRLTAAAEEICGLFERTIAEYEEELSRSKEENERQQKLLDAVFNPQLQLHRADVQQLLVVKEDVLPEQQEWSSSLDQEDPEPPHIKEEQEDPEPPHIKEEQEKLWTSQEGEQLQGLEEADIKFPFSPVSGKSEDDEEEPQSSQLHERQTEQMETEADGEDCGGPEPARNSDPERHPEPDTVDKTGDSSEPETENSDDWKETREPQSSSSSLNNVEVLVGDWRFVALEKRFCCSQCGKRFWTRGHLRRHIRSHTGEKPFSCSVCKKSFARKGHVPLHMRLHTGEKPFSCSVCDKRFTWSNQVKLHKCVGHQSSQLHQTQTEENRDAERPASSSTKQIETEADGEECGGLEPARNSVPDRHPEPDTVDKTGDSSEPETDNSDDWKETREPQSGLSSLNNDKIPVSDSRCSTDRNFIIIDDDDEVPVSDSRCSAGEKPFNCSECDKRFDIKIALTSHMRYHKLERNFSCSVCEKSFARIGSLEKHMRIHNGEKPFSCTICDKVFTECGNLKRHLRCHTGERPFSCSVCNKTYAQRRSLLLHTRSHTGEKPFSCSVCEKSFVSNAHLKNHMKTHTGEKPFSCSVCGKRFSEKSSITHHMVVHTREKRFSCSVCNRRFAWRRQIKSHKCVGHQSQTEENREAEPPASSSTEHMITQNLFINDIITDLSSLVTSSVTSPHFV